MSITRLRITAGNEKQIADYLAINHPNCRILARDEYQFAINGQRLRSDVQLKPGKRVTLALETEEGIDLSIPMEVLRKPSTAIIPVMITEDEDLDLEFVIQDARKEKVQYLGSEKVHSFQNFEIRGGKVVPRTNNKLMNEETILIIKA